ncbi:MAG: hypothetical protein ACI35Z_14845 [Sphingobacterium hotanense]
MKTSKLILSAIAMLSITLYGCSKSESVKAEWEYQGPKPAIEKGNTVAQNICFELYQQFDLHAYYNLSATDALRTPMGMTQTNPIIRNNSSAIPMQAADETIANQFFTLLKKVYTSLPKEMVERSQHKRVLLVKIKPAITNYRDQDGNPYRIYSFAEDAKGVLYFGYQNNATDNYNRFEAELKDWKRAILHEFFRGHSLRTYKGDAIPTGYGNISQGLYYYEITDEIPSLSFSRVFNTNIGLEAGFIHPLAVMADSNNPSADLGSLVAWILTNSKESRMPLLEDSWRLMDKYKMAISFYKTKYNLDLEDLSRKIQNITLN